MANLRVMFVNTSDDTSVTITTKSEDKVDYCRLATDTDPARPERVESSGVDGPWSRAIRPGEIWGVATNKPLSIYNPSSSALSVVYANGKDPWPDPPPSSKKLNMIPNYAVRYKNFLLASGPVMKNAPTTCAVVVYPDGRITPREDADPPPVQQNRHNTNIEDPEVPADTPQVARTVHALLITGYEINDASGTTTVAYAEDAIDALAADLRSRFPSTNTIYSRVMPTQAQVQDTLDKIRASLSDNDLVVVMFAGHGQPANKSRDQKQAWMLSPNQLFTVDNLTRSMKAFPATTDTVVISDCCYGSGFFRARTGEGDGVRAGTPPDGLPLPHEPSFTEKLRLLDHESRDLGDALTRAWDGARDDQPRSNLVSIAAASEWGTVLEHNMAKLANDVVAAARADWTYSQLKTSFKKDQAAGRSFFVDVRPKERIDDAVLGTQPTTISPAPTNDR